MSIVIFENLALILIVEFFGASLKFELIVSLSLSLWVRD